MTNADLVWNLMKQLEQKEKELNQVIEIIQENNIPLDFKKEDETN